jgi:hypothetical protein
MSARPSCNRGRGPGIAIERTQEDRYRANPRVLSSELPCHGPCFVCRSVINDYPCAGSDGLCDNVFGEVGNQFRLVTDRRHDRVRARH